MLHFESIPQGMDDQLPVHLGMRKIQIWNVLANKGNCPVLTSKAKAALLKISDKKLQTNYLVLKGKYPTTIF